MDTDSNLVPERPWEQARQEQAAAREEARVAKLAQFGPKKRHSRVWIWFVVLPFLLLLLGFPLGMFTTDPCDDARTDYKIWTIDMSGGNLSEANHDWDKFLRDDALCHAK